MPFTVHGADDVQKVGGSGHAPDQIYQFELRPGTYIRVPEEAVVALVESTSPTRDAETPWVWYLKDHGKGQYSFQKPGKLGGFILFVPDELAPGDELVVLWKDPLLSG